LLAGELLGGRSASRDRDRERDRERERERERERDRERERRDKDHKGDGTARAKDDVDGKSRVFTTNQPFNLGCIWDILSTILLCISKERLISSTLPSENKNWSRKKNIEFPHQLSPHYVELALAPSP
jgi:hypothetical protein